MLKKLFRWKAVKSTIIIVLLSIIMLINMSDRAFANYYVDKYTYTGAWTSDADKSIYGKDSEVQYDENSAEEGIIEGPGFLENMFIGLVKALTDGLYLMMDAIGITIDNVIYGRVGGHTKNGINLFKFELQKGNPYGVVGAVVYNIIAGIAIIFIVISIFAKFARAMYYSGSSQKWSEFKSSIGISIMSLALITFMPYFLDIAHYLADVVLFTVSKDGSLNLFASTSGFDIVYSFREMASISFLNTLIYLSTVVLSLYFASIYVGYALSMVVLFICFPIVCVGMGFDKKLVSEWGKQVLSILLIPIMDCILLMIPVYFGLLPNGGSTGIIKILLCAMIVPARNIMRQLLGLRSTGMELTGLATMMGAMRLAGAAGGAISKVKGGMKSAKEDDNMANYYSEAGMNDGSNETSNGGQFDTPGGLNPTDVGTSPGAMGGAASTGGTSYMGKGTEGLYSRSAEKYANINNFESQAFRGGLSNEKMAELYRQRANQRRKEAGSSAVGALAGGVLGAGSGMFMGPGFSTHMGAMGVMAGGALGNLVGEHNAVGSSPAPERYPVPEKSPEAIPRVEGEVIDNVPENYEDDEGMDYKAIGMHTVGIGMKPISKQIPQMDASEYANHDEPIRNTFTNTQDYLRNNIPVAVDSVEKVALPYTANNGERLKAIYEQIKVKNSNKSIDTSNDQIRSDIREEASKLIMSDYRNAYNNQAINTSDEKANQVGFDKCREMVNRMVTDKNKGYLSENVFDTFDWMPRRDKETE